MIVRPLSKAEIEDRIEQIAALRVGVFRDWPYLYDGDATYEENYVKTYLDAEGAFIAGAFAGDKMVGACTATPLDEHDAAFAEPLKSAAYELSELFYFGESVLLPEFRGEGVGVRFFQLREEEAKRQGFKKCIFSAVIRPDDHPARPSDYVPLDQFWCNRGYEKLEGIETSYAWKDLGDMEQTDKPMAYWHKSLGPLT